jgi:hypothetical protein
VGLRRPSAYLSIVILASGCVLAVPSASAGGSHCRFAGAETACGACIRAECIDSVDACCFDDECGGIIADVDRCATSGACGRVLDAAEGGGAHRPLSECVARACGTACAGAAANVTSCKPAYATSVDACSCEPSSKPNDAICTEQGHPRLRCCAPPGWPGPALRCDCLAIICVPIADGCQCELSGIDDLGRATECNGVHCCANASLNTCACSSRACLPQETEVSTCTLDELGCPSGTSHVTTCSVPKG